MYGSQAEVNFERRILSSYVFHVKIFRKVFRINLISSQACSFYFGSISFFKKLVLHLQFLAEISLFIIFAVRKLIISVDILINLTDIPY